MAINGVGGSGFNPYSNGVSSPRGGMGGVDRGTSPAQRPAAEAAKTGSKSIAEAIKHDATARADQVNSSKAPEGVDQELWSVLSKEERMHFVKAGAMGPLTYGRFSASSATTSAPLMRGGRLDIKA